MCGRASGKIDNYILLTSSSSSPTPSSESLLFSRFRTSEEEIGRGDEADVDGEDDEPAEQTESSRRRLGQPASRLTLRNSDGHPDGISCFAVTATHTLERRGAVLDDVGGGEVSSLPPSDEAGGLEGVRGPRGATDRRPSECSRLLLLPLLKRVGLVVVLGSGVSGNRPLSPLLLLLS